MTHDEVVDLLEELIGAYPYYASKIIDAEDTINRWEREFGAYEAGDIYKAARVHENTSRFFPSIKEIKGLINKGKISYGDIAQDQPVIEAPKKLIQADVGEEAKCRLEKCILYHDLCNGLNENGECPFEGL